MSCKRERSSMADPSQELSQGWMHKADHDIGIAQLALNQKPEYTDAICFHCQQAAEKYLKALLVFKEIDFKRTHSLTYLLDLLSEKINISEKLYSYVEKLESFAVEVRYPDDMYEPTHKEAKEALNAAVKIKTFVLSKITTK